MLGVLLPCKLALLPAKVAELAMLSEAHPCRDQSGELFRNALWQSAKLVLLSSRVTSVSDSRDLSASLAQPPKCSPEDAQTWGKSERYGRLGSFQLPNSGEKRPTIRAGVPWMLMTCLKNSAAACSVCSAM